MTATRERAIIGEVLDLLRMGDKDIADRYHKELEQVQSFKDARIEAKLEVIADELDMEIKMESQARNNPKNDPHYKGIAAGTIPEMN